MTREREYYASCHMKVSDDSSCSLFALALQNVTYVQLIASSCSRRLSVNSSESEFRDYLSQQFFPNISTSNLSRIASLYPATISAGSPFDTGTANALTPESKRLSALIGDLTFQSPRRSLLNDRPEGIRAWSRCEIWYKSQFAILTESSE